jgi:hypothetical protein
MANSRVLIVGLPPFIFLSTPIRLCLAPGLTSEPRTSSQPQHRWLPASVSKYDWAEPLPEWFRYPDRATIDP